MFPHDPRHRSDPIDDPLRRQSPPCIGIGTRTGARVAPLPPRCPLGGHDVSRGARLPGPSLPERHTECSTGLYEVG